MTKKFCDRCGHEVTTTQTVLVRLSQLEPEWVRNRCTPFEHELCEGCNRKLREWLRNGNN